MTGAGSPNERCLRAQRGCRGESKVHASSLDSGECGDGDGGGDHANGERPGQTSRGHLCGLAGHIADTVPESLRLGVAFPPPHKKGPQQRLPGSHGLADPGQFGEAAACSGPHPGSRPHQELPLLLSKS